MKIKTNINKNMKRRHAMKQTLKTKQATTGLDGSTTYYYGLNDLRWFVNEFTEFTSAGRYGPAQPECSSVQVCRQWYYYSM